MNDELIEIGNRTEIKYGKLKNLEKWELGGKFVKVLVRNNVTELVEIVPRQWKSTEPVITSDKHTDPASSSPKVSPVVPTSAPSMRQAGPQSDSELAALMMKYQKLKIIERGSLERLRSNLLDELARAKRRRTNAATNLKLIEESDHSQPHRDAIKRQNAKYSDRTPIWTARENQDIKRRELLAIEKRIEEAREELTRRQFEADSIKKEISIVEDAIKNIGKK